MSRLVISVALAVCWSCGLNSRALCGRQAGDPYGAGLYDPVSTLRWSPASPVLYGLALGMDLKTVGPLLESRGLVALGDGPGSSPLSACPGGFCRVCVLRGLDCGFGLALRFDQSGRLEAVEISPPVVREPGREYVRLAGKSKELADNFSEALRLKLLGNATQSTESADTRSVPNAILHQYLYADRCLNLETIKERDPSTGIWGRQQTLRLTFSLPNSAACRFGSDH